MTTLKDLIRDFADEVIRDHEDDSLDVDVKLDELMKTIKERIIG